MNNHWNNRTVSWFPFLNLPLKTYKEFFISNFRRYLNPNCRPKIQCWLSAIINTMSWIYRKLWIMPSIIMGIVCLKTSFIISGNIPLVHVSSKCMYIIMVDRDRINVMQKFFKILKFIVIYIVLKLRSCNLLIMMSKVELWNTQITWQQWNQTLKNAFKRKGLLDSSI